MPKLQLIILECIILISIFNCTTDYSTKKEYKYLNSEDVNIRTIDSTIFADTLRYLVDHNKVAFYPEIYDKEAKIQISRILYSPDSSKFAVFVTVKTKRSKNKYSFEVDPNFPNYYYGTIFIGKKGITGQIASFRWLRLVNIGSNKDFEYATISLNSFAFVGLSQLRNQQGKNYYNLDDIRFWDHFHWE